MNFLALLFKKTTFSTISAKQGKYKQVPGKKREKCGWITASGMIEKRKNRFHVLSSFSLHENITGFQKFFFPAQGRHIAHNRADP